MERYFPIEVVDQATGNRRTIYVTKSNPTGTETGDIFLDRSGTRYGRVRGIQTGVVKLAAPVESDSPSATPALDPPAREGFPSEPHGAPFPVAVHGKSGLAETVRVTKHTRPDGQTIYVSNDGRIFERRSHGLSGVVEIGVA